MSVGQESGVRSLQPRCRRGCNHLVSTGAGRSASGGSVLRSSKSVLVVTEAARTSPPGCVCVLRHSGQLSPESSMHEIARWEPCVVIPAVSPWSGRPALSSMREDCTAQVRWLKTTFYLCSGGKKSKIKMSVGLLPLGRENLFLASLLASGGCCQFLAITGL